MDAVDDDVPWVRLGRWALLRRLWRVRTRLASVTWVPFGVPWADRLRGEPFYRVLQSQATILRMLGSTGRVTIVGAAERRVTIRTRDVVIVEMPCLPHHAELVELCRSVGARLVVDVTGDTLGLARETPLDADLAGLRNTDETNAFWAQDEPRSVLGSALCAADCVTTSWEYLVAPLENLTGGPVVHLPDWHVEDTKPFLLGFSRIAEALNPGGS